MWNLSALFDTSESGDGEKWRTVLSSHPIPWRKQPGQPCSWWSYKNAHQCPQLLGIQSSITCLPTCQRSRKLHSAMQVPDTGILSYGSSAMWAKVLLSSEAAVSTGERHLFSYYLETRCEDGFAGSFSSHCWKGIMKEEHYLIDVNAIHAAIAFTFCQGWKSKL